MFEEMELSKVDWGKIAGYAILVLNVCFIIYNRWSAAHMKKFPSIMARKQLYGYLMGLLNNDRAWWKSNDSVVAYTIDTDSNAVSNGTTGAVNKAAGLCIKIDYSKKPSILMASGRDVFAKLSKGQAKKILRLAKTIGGELDEIAGAQSTLSEIPRA